MAIHTIIAILSRCNEASCLITMHHPFRTLLDVGNKSSSPISMCPVGIDLINDCAK